MRIVRREEPSAAKPDLTLATKQRAIVPDVEACLPAYWQIREFQRLVSRDALPNCAGNNSSWKVVAWATCCARR